MMVKAFWDDLKRGQAAEEIVLQELQKRMPDYTFVSVGNDKEYWHKGDIKAVDADGKEIMIEVKDDSCIGKTYNVLCEEEVYYADSGATKKGFMYSDYEIFCVISRDTRKMYMIDFNVLRQIYKKGDCRQMRYCDQSSIVYLLSLGIIKKYKGLIAVIDY